MTRGNIAELTATAFVPLLIVLLCVRTIGYGGEQCSGGEGVSQPPLKDKAFFTFVNQNPPFELRPKTAFRLPSWPIQVRVPTFQFPSAVDCMVGLVFARRSEGHTFESCRARPCADGVIPFYRTLWSGIRVIGALPPFTNQTYDISSNPSHEVVREGRSELGSYALKYIR